MQGSTAKKLQRIQSLFDAGKSHAEIAKELGYTKIESFYRYIYRYDDSLNYKKLFNKKSLSVVPKEETQKKSKVNITVEAIPQTKENISKAESIVSLISRGMDVREVTKKKRFKDMQEMADYMKIKGYIWNSSEKNYVLVPQEKKAPPERTIMEERQERMVVDEIREAMNRDDKGGCECLERYGDILKLLNDNRGKLHELLNGQANQGEIPRYIISGDVKTKSMKINDTLDRLIYDFSQEKNVSQKDIIQAALVEFFNKYGYKYEVKASLRI